MASVTTVIPPKLHTDSTYTFASLPRALVLNRRRLRDYNKADELAYRKSGNLLGERQALGKSVPWAAWKTTVSPEVHEFKETPSTRITLARRQELQRRARTSSVKAPVVGRKHLEVQTELYLEELTDSIVEVDATCQTEEQLSESPSTPNFVPIKLGTDAATQIDDGELFDFDMESQPVLEVLVGKTIQHSLIEVLQEEDVADIKRQRRRFEQLRKAYLAGEKWLQEQEKKLLNGYDGHTLNGKVLDGHGLNTMHLLHAWGYVSDPIKKDLERVFLPWVLDEVEGELNQPALSETVQNSL